MSAMHARDLSLLVGLLLFGGCSNAPKTVHDASSAVAATESPPPLAADAFAAATAEDLRETGETEGRVAVAQPHDLAELDTFAAPAILDSSAFARATREDAAHEAGEAEERTPPAATAAPAAALFQITLQRSFVEAIKNRATITTNFQVMGSSKVHDIGAGGDDGDIHVGGVSDEVGLPCVAEVMNAKGNAIVARIKTLQEDQEVVPVTGTWRLWCEHPGVPQVQFDTPFEGFPSNPDHVFELHPVTKFDGTSLLATWKPIPDYTAYGAKKAFDYYESIPCKLEVDSDTVTIRTPQAKYNYATFTIQLEEDAHLVTTEGRIVRCSVLDEHGTVVTKNRRMVFAKNTPPEKNVRMMKKGDRMTVLGIPRINLAVISWRARNALARPEVLSWRLPYEMIVVAAISGSA